MTADLEDRRWSFNEIYILRLTTLDHSFNQIVQFCWKRLFKQYHHEDMEDAFGNKVHSELANRNLLNRTYFRILESKLFISKCLKSKLFKTS